MRRKNNKPQLQCEDESLSVLFIRLESELKKMYKSYCARRGETMHENIREHVEACVRKDMANSSGINLSASNAAD